MERGLVNKVAESSTNRDNFYIHGGDKYGDNGGIDLAKEDARFFNTLESLKQEYKKALDSIKDDKGRIVVKLDVGYEEENLSEIEVVRKDDNVKMYRISNYSLNIIKKMAKRSNNPIVTITSTTRTPMEQAEEMYEGCVSEGIQEQYKLYAAAGDKVIKVYEDLHKTKTKQEVIRTMYDKIVALGAYNVSHHCIEDVSKINTIDISVWRLKNPKDFKKEIQKFEALKKLKFIDETKRQCYHIEIIQP